MPIPNVPETQRKFLLGVAKALTLPSPEYPLEFFFREPPVKPSLNLIWRLLNETFERGVLKQYGAPTHNVGKRSGSMKFARPFHWGEASQLEPEDLDTLNEEGADYALQRAEVIREHAGHLSRRWRLAKAVLQAMAIQTGRVQLAENGVVSAIDYGFHKLTDPSSAWDDATNGDPVADILTWKLEFLRRYRRYPDTVFYNPFVDTVWSRSAKFLAHLDRHKTTFADWLGQRMPAPYNLPGFRFLDMNWIPISDVYEQTPGDENTVTDIWPVNHLTFALLNPARGGNVLEWWKAKTVETDGTGGLVFDMHEADEPKGTVRVRGYANGMPIVRIAKRFMYVADVGADSQQ